MPICIVETKAPWILGEGEDDGELEHFFLRGSRGEATASGTR
jgi:hypothetical protein